MIKLLKRLDLKEILLIIAAILLIVLQVWLDLKLPDYMAEITKLVQASGSTIKDILIPGTYMLICALGSLTSAITVGYLASYVAASFAAKTRKSVFDKVESFGVDQIKKFSTGSLITRTTNDITQVQTLIAMGLQLIIKAPITAVWAILKIINKNWEWSMITGIAILILIVLVVILMIIVLPKFKKIQSYIDDLNNVVRENLTGIRVIRAFNAEKYQEDKFSRANKALSQNQLFTQKSMALLSPIMYLIMYLLTLSIYFVGANLIANADMTSKIPLFGDMIVFSSYAMQVVMSVLMLAIIFIIYPRASVSIRRINEVLSENKSLVDGKYNKKPNNIKGTVKFNNVSFKYPDAEEYMIKNISFEIKQGETVAFIGSTGCGKSTLINLIPRFYDATDGEVLVDDINVKDYKTNLLHNIIGYVPQKAIMFSGTIASNIDFGSSFIKTNNKLIKEAIKVAEANEFVQKMDKKYDSHISQGGTNISGGQKQRLAIARVIARKPEIYIFDDTFSALDYKTDFTLRKQLKEYTKDATTIIVAQRIGTIMNADKIIVLEDGNCVGIGNHKELMASCKVYQEIALSQLSKEEL